MRLRLLLPTLTAGLLALTACGSETTPPADATVTEPAPGLTPDDTDDLTDLTFQITWAQASEPEKDDLCTSLTLLGPEWAADEMQAGADSSTDLDWDRMTELLGDECALR